MQGPENVRLKQRRRPCEDCGCRDNASRVSLTQRSLGSHVSFNTSLFVDYRCERNCWRCVQISAAVVGSVHSYRGNRGCCKQTGSGSLVGIGSMFVCPSLKPGGRTRGHHISRHHVRVDTTQKPKRSVRQRWFTLDEGHNQPLQILIVSAHTGNQKHQPRSTVLKNKCVFTLFILGAGFAL